jgi:hypothetical protein
MFDGMPWPLLLPLASLFMIWGIMKSKAEIAIDAQKELKQKAKKKSNKK